MRFLSVCSGIEAASVAFAPLGWKAAAFSEIEPFPSAVLAHHYPDTPNLGNMTKHQEWSLAPIGLVCGGTPCQAFSVAGQRRSMDDERGNLSLTFCRIADQFDPEWVLWENVPGVLSTHDNAFGCFLAELVGADEPFDAPGGKWPKWGVVTGPKRTAAWRVLDAQFFGVAQRRRRVFVLASRGSRDWRSAAALFPVGESVHWNSAPSREAREESAAGTLGSTQGGSDVDHARAGHLTQAFGGNQTSGPRSVASALSAHGGACGRMDFETETFVAATITRQIGEQTGQDARNGNLIPVAFDTTQVTSAANRSNPTPGDPCHPLAAGAHAPAIAFTARQAPDAWQDRTGPVDTHNGTQAVAFTTKLHNTASNQSGKVYEEYATSLDRSSPPPALLTPMRVRRLTPRECEALQGFQAEYTAIPWRGKPADECPDGPRYKALGNSWAVPCVAWIGQRIEWVRQQESRAAA